MIFHPNRALLHSLDGVCSEIDQVLIDRFVSLGAPKRREWWSSHAHLRRDRRGLVHLRRDRSVDARLRIHRCGDLHWWWRRGSNVHLSFLAALGFVLLLTDSSQVS